MCLSARRLNSTRCDGKKTNLLLWSVSYSAVFVCVCVSTETGEVSVCRLENLLIPEGRWRLGSRQVNKQLGEKSAQTDLHSRTKACAHAPRKLCELTLERGRCLKVDFQS